MTKLHIILPTEDTALLPKESEKLVIRPMIMHMTIISQPRKTDDRISIRRRSLRFSIIFPESKSGSPFSILYAISSAVMFSNSPPLFILSFIRLLRPERSILSNCSLITVS